MHRLHKQTAERQTARNFFNNTFQRLIELDEPVNWRGRFDGPLSWEDPASLLAAPETCEIYPAELQNALIALLTSIGWLMPVLVNSLTEEVIWGHPEVLVALSLGVSAIPVQRISLTRTEQLSVITYLRGILRQAYFDPVKTEENLGELDSSRVPEARRLLHEMVAYEVVPAEGTHLRSRNEQRLAPLEYQECIKRQTARGRKELWGVGEARVFGTPEECRAIIEPLQAAGLVATRLKPSSLVKRVKE